MMLTPLQDLSMTSQHATAANDTDTNHIADIRDISNVISIPNENDNMMCMTENVV